MIYNKEPYINPAPFPEALLTCSSCSLISVTAIIILNVMLRLVASAMHVVSYRSTCGVQGHEFRLRFILYPECSQRCIASVAACGSEDFAMLRTPV